MSQNNSVSNSSQPLARLQQLRAGAGGSKSPTPTFNVSQWSSESPLVPTRQMTPLVQLDHSNSLSRSPPTGNAVPVVGPAVGRSPSPATATISSQRSSSPLSVEAPPPVKRRRIFHRDLKYMMHGFGDDPNPYSETVDLVEELVVQFITEMTLKAMEVGKSGRVNVNDIIFIIRKDKKKYARVKDLLNMKEQIDKAKKAFEEDSEAVMNS